MAQALIKTNLTIQDILGPREEEGAPGDQWLNEEGATAFLRAAQSGDLALLKLLVAK